MAVAGWAAGVWRSAAGGDDAACFCGGVAASCGAAGETDAGCCGLGEVAFEGEEFEGLAFEGAGFEAAALEGAALEAALLAAADFDD
jgi:hypothetical protein